MNRVVTLLICLLLVRPIVAAATDITSCGETIAVGDTGVLQADLDCAGGEFGVRVLRHATLDLNGHTISSDSSTFATVLGVARTNGSLPLGSVGGPAVGSGPSNFTIRGPGVIAGVSSLPVYAAVPACVLLNGGRAKITSATGTVEIRDCSSGVLGSSARSPNRGTLEIDHAEVHGQPFSGIVVKTLVASDLTVHDTSGVAVSVGGKAEVTNVVIHDNYGNGLFAGRKLTGNGVTATDNQYNGAQSFSKVELTGVTATGNAFGGVVGKIVRLTDSTVTGSGLADIISATPPALVNTTCGTSRDFATGDTWGVCAND